MYYLFIDNPEIAMTTLQQNLPHKETFFVDFLLLNENKFLGRRICIDTVLYNDSSMLTFIERSLGGRNGIDFQLVRSILSRNLY